MKIFTIEVDGEFSRFHPRERVTKSVPWNCHYVAVLCRLRNNNSNLQIAKELLPNRQNVELNLFNVIPS